MPDAHNELLDVVVFVSLHVEVTVRLLVLLEVFNPLWNCERRQYSWVSDQPDVGPINMHTSITPAEAIRINIATSGRNPARHTMVCIVLIRFLIVAL